MTYRGELFQVESARVWDLPETAPPIGIAVSGPGSCRVAGRCADAMIAAEPRGELGRLFDDAGGRELLSGLSLTIIEHMI